MLLCAIVAIYNFNDLIKQEETGSDKMNNKKGKALFSIVTSQPVGRGLLQGMTTSWGPSGHLDLVFRAL